MNEKIEQINEIGANIITNGKPISEVPELKKLTTNSENAQDKNVPKKRQIVIETDGNSINLVKAEVAGAFELVAILQELTALIKSKK